jgi:hypothetical protein
VLIRSEALLIACCDLLSPAKVRKLSRLVMVAIGTPGVGRKGGFLPWRDLIPSPSKLEPNLRALRRFRDLHSLHSLRSLHKKALKFSGMLQSCPFIAGSPYVQTSAPL